LGDFINTGGIAKKIAPVILNQIVTRLTGSGGLGQEAASELESFLAK